MATRCRGGTSGYLVPGGGKGRGSSVRGNNQHHRDVGWLAGIVDGEGCVYVNRQSPAPYCMIAIVNTDLALLGKVQRVLDALGIRWRIYAHKRTGLAKRQRYDLHVHGRESERLCELLNFDLTAKQEKARVVMQIADSRARA